MKKANKVTLRALWRNAFEGQRSNSTVASQREDLALAKDKMHYGAAIYTRLVKPFAQIGTRAKSCWLSCTHNLRKTSVASAHSYGFTLVEVLITLTILGVVAAITVPSLLAKTTERQNKVKIKKAMSVYEQALSTYYVNYPNGTGDYSTEYNAIKKDPNGELTALRNSGVKTSDQAYKDKNAELTAAYKAGHNAVKDKYAEPFLKGFNMKENEGGGIFQTKDGLWWNVYPTATDNSFLSVIVSFKRENLTTAKADDIATNDAFYFAALQKPFLTTPVVNPTNEYGNSIDFLSSLIKFMKNEGSDNKNKARMQKLYAYIGMPLEDYGFKSVVSSRSACANVSGNCTAIENFDTSYWRSWATRFGVDTSNFGKEVYVSSDGDYIKFYLLGKDNKILAESEVTYVTTKGDTVNAYSDKVTVHNADGTKTCYKMQSTYASRGCLPSSAAKLLAGGGTYDTPDYLDYSRCQITKQDSCD